MSNLKKERKTGQWKKTENKEKKKRNLYTVQHGMKKKKKEKQTFLGKIDSA